MIPYQLFLRLSEGFLKQSLSSLCFRALRITSTQCFVSRRIQSDPQQHDLMISTHSILESKTLWNNFVSLSVSTCFFCSVPSQCESTQAVSDIVLQNQVGGILYKMCAFVLEDGGNQQHRCRGQAGASGWSGVRLQRPVGWHYPGYGHTDGGTGGCCENKRSEYTSRHIQTQRVYFSLSINPWRH